MYIIMYVRLKYIFYKMYIVKLYHSFFKLIKSVEYRINYCKMKNKMFIIL